MSHRHFPDMDENEKKRKYFIYGKINNFYIGNYNFFIELFP